MKTSTRLPVRRFSVTNAGWRIVIDELVWFLQTARTVELIPGPKCIVQSPPTWVVVPETTRKAR
jgi:hypothetical protein